MFGSICLLFADDAVFLTLVEFLLKHFGAQYDELGVNARSLGFFKLAADLCSHSPIRAKSPGLQLVFKQIQICLVQLQ